jgi:hypothetical protein
LPDTRARIVERCYELSGQFDGRTLLFLKKKKQKDFYPFGWAVATPATQRTKILWFFLSRKNNFSLPSARGMRQKSP